MNVLIIGGGGREHAIAWKISQSPLCDTLIAAPGNPGIAQVARCVTPPSSDPAVLVNLAREFGADVTIVGPEVPLVAGVADAFRSAGLTIIGPTAEAARLEGSKVYAKEFMTEFDIPTARYRVADNAAEARKALADFDFPVVLKADGLAAGKGVVIAHDAAEAAQALTRLPQGRFVVEECLRGEEVSYIAYSTGSVAIPFDTTQDHKAAFDGDKGPNTGGMGAYCDTRILSDEQRRLVEDAIIAPTLEGMRRRGTIFTGFLYAGLMMTDDGPKVLEFNVRLGDPEAQPLMYRMKSDLLATLLDGEPMEWNPDPSVCVVMAAAGYPGPPRTGDLITGIEDCGATVFLAGAKTTADGLVTAGGRVLGVTSSGPDLRTAIANTYAAVEKIHFDAAHYRTDIGQKGLKRW